MSDHKILFLDLGTHIFNTWDWISGYQITRVARPDTFLDKLQASKQEFDLLMIQVPPEQPGVLEVLSPARELAPEAGVMVLSGVSQHLFPLETYQAEMDDYLFLPCSLTELLRRVSACLERVNGRRQVLSASLSAVNQRVLRKLLHRIHYIRHSLDSSAADLRYLLQNNGGKMDDSLHHRLQEVSAGIKVLLGLTKDYQRQVLSRNPSKKKRSGILESSQWSVSSSQ